MQKGDPLQTCNQWQVISGTYPPAGVPAADDSVTKEKIIESPIHYSGRSYLEGKKITYKDGIEINQVTRQQITLRGKVLPVGGIKEKILAAKRARIKEIILSKKNKADILEINEKYLRGLKFHYVENISEVLKIAITNRKAVSTKYN